jgi:hypothetical protein
MFSAPTEFDRQDEGHSAHNPLSWNIITKLYYPVGQFPYKKYGNTHVLTGPFSGLQSNNKENVIQHFSNRKEYDVMHKLKYQKSWIK